MKADIHGTPVRATAVSPGPVEDLASTDAERRRALHRLDEGAETLRRQREALVRSGLSGEDLGRAMAPLVSLRVGLEEEVAAYERSRGAAG